MEKFEINILGCGSALPTTRHYNSSQVINIREKLYMIDCGEGTQMQLRRSQLRFNRLGHIFISHLHGDHCFGLVGMISTFGLMGRTADLHIHAPAPLQQLLQPLLDFHCQGIDYKVTFHEIDTKTYQQIYEDRSVEVFSIPLKHRVPCCGFLFKEKPLQKHIRRDMIDFYQIPHYAINNIKDGEDYVLTDGTTIPNERLTLPAAKARSYAYCSDTSFLPQRSTYLQGVDLLYHEATFANDNLPRAKETCHSTARQAAQMAQLCNAQKLVIGHFSARYLDEQILLKEAQEIFSETILAKENLCIEI